MKNRGRRRPKAFLKWARIGDIEDNLQHTIHGSDPIFTVVANHRSKMDEMRHVRNHIAHRSGSTQARFRTIIVQYYGGLKRGMTPSRLLLTQALGSRQLIDEYVKRSRIFVRELVRA